MSDAENGPQHVREGFPGQRQVVLPRPVVTDWLADDPLFALLPSDVGFYPKAGAHFVERPEGTPQLVFIHCLDGEGWLQIAGMQWRVQPGQAVAILPETPHVYGAAPDDPWSIYWVHMAGERVRRVAGMLGVSSTRPLVNVGCDPALPPLFEAMIAQTSRGYTPTILDHASLTLGQLVARLAQDVARPVNGTLSLAARIDRTIALMGTRLTDHITVADLADHANMSASHFASVFKKKTGFSVQDYFLRLKIQRAGVMLDSTSQPIKVIAALLGFNDPLHFSRCFRRIHKCSPSEYRAIPKG